MGLDLKSEDIFKDDPELLVTLGESATRVNASVDAFQRQMRHLHRNIYQAMSGADASPVIRRRQYAGMMHRLDAIAEASFQVRVAYADIWQALEGSLVDAPTKALSERARMGFVGKMAKNAKAREKATAMEAIREVWIARKKANHRFSATEFAHEMGNKYKVVTVESLKNAQTRWSKKYHPAS